MATATKATAPAAAPHAVELAEDDPRAVAMQGATAGRKSTPSHYLEFVKKAKRDVKFAIDEVKDFDTARIVKELKKAEKQINAEIENVEDHILVACSVREADVAKKVPAFVGVTVTKKPVRKSKNSDDSTPSESADASK